LGGEGTGLDFYYQEPGSRIPKEVFWAGDGIQIWLQLLLHVFRETSADTIVLDEPDALLHSDLQRRLVNFLESVPAQVITATHAPDLIMEAPEESIVWVARDRRRAVRAPDAKRQWEMSETLGTAFNLPLARTLRARCVAFVEGKDLKILRNLAQTVGATRLAREAGVAVVPLEGFERWEQVEPFKWLLDNLLRGSVPAYVILDRDYRSQDVVDEIEGRLKSIGVRPHIWSRHELENTCSSPRPLAA
jgi:predicted ATP-dependent endonuclease of OLD family